MCLTRVRHTDGRNAQLARVRWVRILRKGMFVVQCLLSFIGLGLLVLLACKFQSALSRIDVYIALLQGLGIIISLVDAIYTVLDRKGMRQQRERLQPDIVADRRDVLQAEMYELQPVPPAHVEDPAADSVAVSIGTATRRHAYASEA